MSQEVYLNNISVITYNNNTYSVSHKPQVYSINNPLIVSSDNSIDYLSPPWLLNTWSFKHWGDWKYNGKNILKYYADFSYDQLSCGYHLSGDVQNKNNYFVGGYVWNSDDPSSIFYRYGDLYKGTVYIDVPTPLSGEETLEYKHNILYGEFYKKYNTDYVSGVVHGTVDFQGTLIQVQGVLQGNVDPKKLSNGTSLGLKQNSTIYQIAWLKGIIQNVDVIPEELHSSIKNFQAYGWLNGKDNLMYNNKFLYNQISGTICHEGNVNINQAFEGVIQVPIESSKTNIIEGIIYKPYQNSMVSGYLEGNVQIENESILMGGYFIGKVDMTSKQNKNNKTHLSLSWLEGTIYNVQPIMSDVIKIIDIKRNNALGRKNLSKYNSLFGQNLNKTTKNFNIYNKPYMVQTWKIIKYKYDDNTNKNLQLPIYGQKKIDVKTYLATAKQVRQKDSYNTIYEQYPGLVSGYEDIQTSNYYCKWYETQTNNIIMTIELGNKDFITKYFAGPFKTIQQGQIFIKQFLAAKNMKLVNKIDNNYYLENIDVEI